MKLHEIHIYFYRAAQLQKEDWKLPLTMLSWSIPFSFRVLLREELALVSHSLAGLFVLGYLS